MKKITIALCLFSALFCCAFYQKNIEPIISEQQLGEKLFHDKVLSADKTISCASCHKPEFAFADTVAFSKGVGGKLAKRNTPTAMNMLARNIFFFDGRASTLEEQAIGPIQNPDEMDLLIDSAVMRLQASTFYIEAFKKVYGRKPDKENLCSALSSFERTLETGNSDYDAFAKGEKKAISKAALRGKNIFVNKGKCFDCHSGTDFTNDEFRNIGLYDGKYYTDKGRYEITKNKKDLGTFKVAGLRNVAITAPYMHNGKFRTLREVVAYYNNPVKIVAAPINKDSSIQKLNLSVQEQNDLVAFLESLTDRRFKK